jgi:hypothetical protein
MGQLVYDTSAAIEFDDRLLAHLQLVIGAKLRRNESFFLSWKDEQDAGGGRSVIWLHPALAIRFKYVGSRMPLINRNWIDTLTIAANSAGGLMPVTEPPVAARSEDEPLPGA